ncbi:MAG: hypothetical protein LUG64_06365, partial [Clostridiales bacterium]|nr:hypothetical protein [Clostridiales bacterium]
YLPPDNVQELPALGPARRTSPTNIGLALLACLAAADLGVTEKKRTIEKIERQLDTLEQLDKWRGHLYNWYDTAAARPLYPRYVSTVDSGNLCGALIALKQGLLELGEPVLARRAATLADNMQFEHLYDPERELFRIGYDAEQGAFTENWYDLLASEARQTSYLAVARGDVPPRHWGRLSRSMTCLKGRFGLASWSGTMFEYFMPHLLLPAEKGSLLWESLALCAGAQKAWGERNDLPWGVSESAYARLNGELNYQYKAHGVPPLGLQRGLERMRVAAPYATFLALEFLPHSAVQNLRRLAGLGAEGEYGFYEAVDLSGEQPVVVRSWMVHHLGMSLLAIDNALNGSVMRRRFLAEPAMAAYRGLLQERMPLGLTPPKPLHITEKRKTMNQDKAYLRAGQGFDPAAPACHLLAVETLALPLTAGCGGALRREGLLLAGPIEARFRGEGEQLRLFPTGPAGKDLRWRFAVGGAELSVQRDGVALRRRLTLSAGGLLEEWTAETRRAGLLEVRVTPVLDEADAYEAHRAFSRLSLELEPVEGGVILTRRPREGKQTPALAVLWAGDCTLEDAEDCVLRLTLPLQPGKTTLRLALAAGEGQWAFHAAQGLLAGAKIDGEDLFCARSAHYGLTGAAQRQLDQLTSRLLYPRERSGAPKGQSALWPYGVSGDLPLWAVLTAGQEEKQLDRCIRQWAVLRGCGLPFDLALLTPEAGDTARKLTELCKTLHLSDFIGAKGGIHLVPATGAAVEAVTGMADLVGPVGEPENKFQCTPSPAVPLRPGGEPTWRWEGNAFVLETNGGLLPRRWSHILTNGSFGWTADDCGTGHLWAANAHENKLTPWRNDPAAHKGPERLWVEDGGEEVSLFAAAGGISTVIRYGPGLAAWEKRWGNKRISLTAFVPPTGAARFFLVESSGFGPGAILRWRVELQMSPRVRGRKDVVVTPHEGELWAENPANTDFPGEILRFSASGPLALAGRENNYTFTTELPLERELVLAAGLETPLPVAPSEVRRLLEETKQHWEEQAGCFTLRSPDPALNHYLSFWGRYQVIACRLLARSALYQCGGAYGFRDQLQDVCGLLPNGREPPRDQIMRCCRHQYREGDAQHWWHPLAQGERGVRTRISDDLLWLPYSLCRWVSVTGDRSFLDEKAPWLVSQPLQRGEEQRYEEAALSDEADTVLEHGIRAIECCLGRGVGEHGLCLMGQGDWNDGMDRLGREGRGESVWLTWFLSLVLDEFSALCGGERRERYRKLSARLAAKADEAWDGGWYRRAYDDGGQPIGSRESRECRIDSIAQSFSVFAPNPSPERGRQAVQAAIDRLYDREHRTVALLDPPFREIPAGYISAYPGGVRENGGQYTHAAVWLAMAALQLGETEQGWELLQTLLPEGTDHKTYQGEPYVLAGDVSTAEGRQGRAGWTWYTGAAAWFCRAATEELLGLRVRDGRLFVQPRLPQSWRGYQADWRLV